MNSGGASSHAPLPLAARGFTRRLKKQVAGEITRRLKKQAAGEILPSPSPAVAATSTCNRKHKKRGHKQLILDLSFSVF